MKVSNLMSLSMRKAPIAPPLLLPRNAKLAATMMKSKVLKLIVGGRRRGW
jgi:hypothetical protein